MAYTRSRSAPRRSLRKPRKLYSRGSKGKASMFREALRSALGKRARVGLRRGKARSGSKKRRTVRKKSRTNLRKYKFTCTRVYLLAPPITSFQATYAAQPSDVTDPHKIHGPSNLQYKYSYNLRDLKESPKAFNADSPSIVVFNIGNTERQFDNRGCVTGMPGTPMEAHCVGVVNHDLSPITDETACQAYGCYSLTTEGLWKLEPDYTTSPECASNQGTWKRGVWQLGRGYRDGFQLGTNLYSPMNDTPSYGVTCYPDKENSIVQPSECYTGTGASRKPTVYSGCPIQDQFPKCYFEYHAGLVSKDKEAFDPNYGSCRELGKCTVKVDGAGDGTLVVGVPTQAICEAMNDSNSTNTYTWEIGRQLQLDKHDTTGAPAASVCSAAMCALVNSDAASDNGGTGRGVCYYVGGKCSVAVPGGGTHDTEAACKLRNGVWGTLTRIPDTHNRTDCLALAGATRWEMHNQWIPGTGAAPAAGVPSTGATQNLTTAGDDVCSIPSTSGLPDPAGAAGAKLCAARGGTWGQKALVIGDGTLVGQPTFVKITNFPDSRNIDPTREAGDPYEYPNSILDQVKINMKFMQAGCPYKTRLTLKFVRATSHRPIQLGNWASSFEKGLHQPLVPTSDQQLVRDQIQQRILLNDPYRTDPKFYSTIWSHSITLPGCKPGLASNSKIWSVNKTLNLNLKRSQIRYFDTVAESGSGYYRDQDGVAFDPPFGQEVDSEFQQADDGFFNATYLVVTCCPVDDHYVANLSVPVGDSTNKALQNLTVNKSIVDETKAWGALLNGTQPTFAENPLAVPTGETLAKELPFVIPGYSQFRYGGTITVSSKTLTQNKGQDNHLGVAAKYLTDMEKVQHNVATLVGRLQTQRAVDMEFASAQSDAAAALANGNTVMEDASAEAMLE